ncbi:ArsR/SmtB family transcription factor [Shouchella patagoniensis]|uniref:ArsR/SmtB family transcription factor n=1 Tax=Shouchella patagoniensis TaxID=228576 RepID=UPI00099575D7|nr:metalloregulator ArsR/SmtB family transcription factor [Shouchella patagoniensis]
MEQLKEAQLVFKALGEEKRVEIIRIVNAKREICISDLGPLVGMAQSRLSYHMKILLDTEIVKKEKRGTFSYYALNRNVLEAYLLSDTINHLLHD